MTKAKRGPRHAHVRDNERKAEAASRLALRAKRSNADQLRIIATRPGNSARERARLS